MYIYIRTALYVYTCKVFRYVAAGRIGRTMLFVIGEVIRRAEEEDVSRAWYWKNRCGGINWSLIGSSACRLARIVYRSVLYDPMNISFSSSSFFYIGALFPLHISIVCLGYLHRYEILAVRMEFRTSQNENFSVLYYLPVCDPTARPLWNKT